MPHFNQATIVGHVGRDPETRDVNEILLALPSLENGEGVQVAARGVHVVILRDQGSVRRTLVDRDDRIGQRSGKG